MTAIVTITFSPCIDRSASVPSLIPERKLTCSYLKLEPGGGGINVARAIEKLGGEAIAIYPSGGYTGAHFNRLLADEDIPAVIIETENETRENVIILDESENKQYRFGMPGNALKENEWQHMLKAIEGMTGIEFIVASGSLPPGVPDDIFARIAVMARKKNAKMVIDTSGPPLKYAVEEGVYLLKPNLRELKGLVNREQVQTDEIGNYAQQIIQSKKSEVIVVSMGEAGALLVTSTLNKLIPAPKVKRISTVGAGDSMVAGIVLSLFRGKNLEKAVEYGVACGTAATMNPGTELCKKEDADMLFEQLSENQTVL